MSGGIFLWDKKARQEKTIVYDYVDNVGVLEVSAKSRQRVYTN